MDEAGLSEFFAEGLSPGMKSRGSYPQTSQRKYYKITDA
jgi:hypothetical protein